MSSKNIYYYDPKSFWKGLKEKEEEINGVEVFFYVLTFLTYQKGAAPLLVEPKRWPMQEIQYSMDITLTISNASSQTFADDTHTYSFSSCPPMRSWTASSP